MTNPLKRFAAWVEELIGEAHARNFERQEADLNHRIAVIQAQERPPVQLTAVEVEVVRAGIRHHPSCPVETSSPTPCLCGAAEALAILGRK